MFICNYTAIEKLVNTKIVIRLAHAAPKKNVAQKDYHVISLTYLHSLFFHVILTRLCLHIGLR